MKFSSGLRLSPRNRPRAVRLDKDHVVRARTIQKEPDQMPAAEISESDAADKSTKYLPLDQSIERTFRVLTLLPGPKDSQPRCTLSVSTWGDGHCSYEALSYVWGDSEARKPIMVNGKMFEVTENLFSALSHLQFADRPRSLWIDAICIDQENIKERNHQVASMGGIYRNCRKVLIWLGEKDNETESAVDFIKSTFEEIEQKVAASPQYRNSTDLAQLYNFSIPRNVIEELFRPELLAGWKRFEHVLQRTWWTRAWIVQEFANAPNAIFHIGDISMEWTLISALIIVFFKELRWSIQSGSSVLSDISRRAVSDGLLFTRLVTQFEPFTESSTVSKRSPSEIGFLFIALLRCQSFRVCSDPRDKIYSILSLIDTSFSKVLLPDYSKPARYANIAAVRAYINVSKKLDILGCTVGGSTETAGYPSWCPDWDKGLDPRILAIDPHYGLYNSSGITKAVATFSKDESTMYLKGFPICAVVDDFFQDSPEPFIYLPYLKVRSNWDLKLMAQKLQRAEPSFDTSPSKVNPDSSADESKQESCFNTVATTLLEGFWYHYLPSPPVKKDEETKEWWPGGNKTQFLFEAGQRTLDRTVVLCDDGKLGLAPEAAENGDEIWIFMGASRPFLLRKMDEMDGDKKVYQFIGTVYVHGVMKGECMEDLEKGKYEVQTVALR
ncbi:HET-domain-containing protein, partial [Stipitochalara longipes BDJ]